MADELALAWAPGTAILARIFSYAEDADVIGYVNGDRQQRYWELLKLRKRPVILKHPTLTLRLRMAQWGGAGGDADGFWLNEHRSGFPFDVEQRKEMDAEFERVKRFLAEQPVNGILEPVSVSPFLKKGKNTIHVEVTPYGHEDVWSVTYQLLIRAPDGKQDVFSTLLFNKAKPTHAPITLNIT